LSRGFFALKPVETIVDPSMLMDGWSLGGSSPIVDDLKALADALVAAVRELEDRYREVCLEAGNANTKVYQILRDEGPLHLYELIPRVEFSRATVYRALLELRALRLVVKDEKTDRWSAVESQK